MDTLIEQLNQLGDVINNNFHYVNMGGCAVITYAIHKKLIELGVCGVKIVWLQGCYSTAIGDSDFTKTIRTLEFCKKLDLKEANALGLYCYHALVVFDYQDKQYSFDTTGCDESPDMSVYNQVTPTINKKCAGNSAGWNDCFDRGQIPGILRLINSFELSL